MLPERLSEHVDGRDKLRALLGEARMLLEEVIEHVNDEKRHLGHNCSSET
jgi:hypothetical protein